MTVDPRSLRPLLREEARRVLLTFLDDHEEAPTAIGFILTLYNVTPQLDLCAHLGPLSDDEEERWNSGDYDFPAGLTGERYELGATFYTRLAELHTLARNEDHHGPIYRGLIELCALVLFDLRDEGLIPRGIDLNLSEVGDSWERVAERHATMERDCVPDGGEPYAGPP